MAFVISVTVFFIILGVLWFQRHEILDGLEDASEEFSEAVDNAKREVKDLEEKLPSKSDLMKMKKDAIEELGRTFGVELDKRKTKENMVNELEEKVNTK